MAGPATGIAVPILGSAAIADCTVLKAARNPSARSRQRDAGGRQQWICNTTGGQFVNGALRNPPSGKCLDADAWVTTSGAPLIIAASIRPGVSRTRRG
ncbi:RICIN domain-containing protein [Actinoplanes sp. NPDC024001]|uniref:RICIN domain-containing protein n=1 Tax=Actinoplanes sp. NPDC024001 TaxID=3154598 RepID=UPI003409620B